MVPLSDMDARFYSSGRPVRITLSMAVSNSVDGSRTLIAISADDVALVGKAIRCNGGDEPNGAELNWVGILGEGEHYIKGKFAAGANTAQTSKLTDDHRILTVEEL